MSKKIPSASEILKRRQLAKSPGKADEHEAEVQELKQQLLIGEKIHRLRNEAGMTQAQLAEKIGTKASAISRLEDAEYDGHSLDTLRRVAQALEMRLTIGFEPIHPTKDERKEM